MLTVILKNGGTDQQTACDIVVAQFQQHDIWATSMPIGMVWLAPQNIASPAYWGLRAILGRLMAGGLVAIDHRHIQARLHFRPEPSFSPLDFTAQTFHERSYIVHRL